MKKILALLVALLLAASMISAFAANDGKITIKNAEIGKSYQLYKLFDATVGANGETAYKLPSGKTEAAANADPYFSTYFTIKNGFIINDTANGKTEFNEAVLKTDEFKTWALSFGTKIGDAKVATADTVVWDNLAYGYYFIDCGNNANITVDSANPEAEVIDKNGTVDFDKNIIIQAASEGKTEILDKFNEAGLDIPVPFAIDVTAKNYDGTKKIFKYRIKDKIDPGFTFTDNPVVVIDGVTLDASKGEYTITYYTDDTKTTEVTNKAEAQYFEIIIPWTDNGEYTGDHLYSANAKIRVTYNAILDHNKAAEVKVGKDPNLNDAELDWWSDEDEPDRPSGNIPWKTTKTWETWLKIYKTDDKNNQLKGAEFTLSTENGTKVSYVYKEEFVLDNTNGTHWKLNDGTYTTEAPNGNATHDSFYDDLNKKYKLEVTAQVIEGQGSNPTKIASFVGEDGTVLFSGLGTGDYKIEETVVPDGFNKADDLEFTINFAVTDKNTTNPKGEFSVTGKDAGKITLETTNALFETTIVNRTGVELPETGGIGTTIFYIAGSLLVLGAVIFLVTKRRMKVED